MFDRRAFIKNLSAAVAASVAIPHKLFAMSFKKTIGIQLYTIREMVNSDFEGTLKILSEIGYNTFEAAGYSSRKFYGFEPKIYLKICQDHGIIPLSSHSGINPETADLVIEDTINAGMNYLVLPSVPKERRTSLDDYKQLADEFNLIGEKCKNSGLKFGYHNHAFEFEKIDEQCPYDILINNTDPDLCFMQLDVYWMIFGYKDPFEYIQKYPGRFELWHVKDMDNGENRESTEVGYGIIDFEGLFALKEESGMKYFFVEQEVFKIAMIESIIRSYNYLNSL